MAAIRQKSRSHGSPLVLIAAVAGVALVRQILCSGPAFSAALPGQGGLNKKQLRSTIHNKDALGDVLEVPLEEEEPEAPPETPMPVRRVPYSLNIASQFSNGKHLGEDTTARTYIQEKLTGALENFEDLIRSADVHLQVSDNFHKKEPHGHATKTAVTSDGEESISESGAGHKMLAPYIFKATITLANGRSIVLANPEKHAQPTLQEATDHMIDVLKKSLRLEKEKNIQLRKKEKNDAMLGVDGDAEDDIPAEEIAQALEAAADEADEQLYKVVEGSA